VNLTDRPARNDANAIREIDGVVFILEPDTGELHSFNDVGNRIWQLVDGSRTVEAIVAVISDEYDVDHRAALDDVFAFLEQLQEKGIVRA
jgi:hypothetical protein